MSLAWSQMRGCKPRGGPKITLPVQQERRVNKTPVERNFSTCSCLTVIAKPSVAEMSTPTFVILIVCFASIALADDFKTIDGKIYRDATISHVEADGIVIKTKTGISKIYFVELPKDVQERFHYSSATPY